MRPALLMLMLAGLSLACDGTIEVQGRVYEMPATKRTDKGFVIVDTLAEPLPPRLVELEGAEVSLEPRTDQNRPSDSDFVTFWTARDMTDEDGYFFISDVVAPGSYDGTLTVRRRGYEEVSTIFRYDGEEHIAIVVMVSDEPRLP